jgi:hypothetical protein
LQLAFSSPLASSEHGMRSSDLRQTPAPDAQMPIPTSVVFRQLLEEVPSNHFTLDWLLGRLGKRSFGIIMLLLAVVAIAPGVSIFAGLLLFIPAIQMILGHAAPVFPQSIAARPLPTSRLTALVERAVPALQTLEKVVYPRWPIPHQATKRVVGIVVVLLDITLTFTPLPLSNIIPALLIGLISLAYLQEDGLVLSVALALAAMLLTADLLAVRETIRGAEWILGAW